MMQQENQTLINRIGQGQNSASSQIRSMRLKKQLEFLNSYDYLLENEESGTQIIFRNLWGSQEGEYQLGNNMINKELVIFLPNDYPFKQPSFSIDGKQDITISQLIDQWSPKFKIMQMIQLLKKRIQQRHQLQQRLKYNFIFNAFNGMGSLGVFIFLAVVVRVCVEFGGFSGKGHFPNFGDFQAHRNWMAITVNRPVSLWYTEHTQNPWWRIDYPPIAAYLSYILGQICNKIQPEAMKIQHGYESNSFVVFMRFTVVIIDCIFLFPPVYLICKKLSPIRYRNRALFNALIFIIFLKPDQILIDHGHFQYNCLMLGLILYSFYLLINERRYLCCFIFTIAINCKLMSTYFCLAFMGGLIGVTCKKYGRHKKQKIVMECLIYAAIVILTVVVVWIPWLGSYHDFSSVLTAIFPVHRGLYQLKVPNFWCISDVVIKWQSLFSKQVLVIICMISCVVFSLPAMVALVVKPTQKVFVCAFSCIAMTFFMFSYHVHEKSILVPLCMIPFISQFIGGNLVVDLVIGGCAGMYHLLCEDGQKMQYFVLLILYGVFANSFYVAQNIFMSIYHPRNRRGGLILSLESRDEDIGNIGENFHNEYFNFNSALRIFYVFVILVILHIGQLLIDPPESLPYLWNLLFAFYSFVLNSYFLVLSNLILVFEIKTKFDTNKKQ